MWNKFVAWLRSLFSFRRKSRPPNCTINAYPQHKKVLSEGLGQWGNPHFHRLEPLAGFHCVPFVFLYNLSEESFKIVGHPVFGSFTIAGRLSDERYRFITSVPEYVHPTKFNLQTSDIEATNLLGVRAVVDLINPDNWTNDLDYEVSPETSFSIGNDLSKKGVFFSLSNPPVESDIIAAERRMAAFLEKQNARRRP
jgi:hypothetical protein